MTNLLNRNKCFDSGESPLTLAAREGHEAVVETLLRGGADVNQRDRLGQRPLNIAARINDLETVNICLEAHADPNLLDTDGTTALQGACQRGYSTVVRRLLAAGAYPDGDRRAPFPPLIHAVVGQHTDCVAALLQAKASASAGRDARGNSPLHIAVSAGDAATVLLLLKHGADANAGRRADGASLASLAAVAGSVGSLRALVDARCDITTGSVDSPPPLVAAAARGDAECIEVLLAAGAGVDGPDRRGETPLQVAVYGVVDAGRAAYYTRYFSNVYRGHGAADPGEVHAERAICCAMRLVQAGADVGRVWHRFVDVFPADDVTPADDGDDSSGVGFEQMVLCEVLIQAFGFGDLSQARTDAFVGSLLRVREYGLLKLLYSAGVDPSWEATGALGLSAHRRDRQMFKWVRHLRSNPRQLRDLCRQTVRRCLSRNVLYLAEKLSVPADVKEYVAIMSTDYYSHVDLPPAEQTPDKGAALASNGNARAVRSMDNVMLPLSAAHTASSLTQL